MHWGTRFSNNPAQAPTTPTDPVQFAQTCLNFHPDPKQAEILRCTAPATIICMGRQYGKSTIVALKALHHAYTHPNSTIVVVGPAARQSNEFLHKVKVFLRQLNIRTRGDGHNRDSLKLPNGSRLIALPASEATTRGFSALAMLIIEEASRVPNSEYQALRPMLATSNGSVTLLSTPNGRRGFFHDVWTSPDGTWTKIFAPSTECPRITKEFLDLERLNQPDKWFRQEYLCEFLNDAESYFSYEKVKACFTDSIPAQAEEVFYGLDLGKERNHAALARIDRVEVVSETLNRATWERQTSWSYRLTALDRFPLGTTYTEVVQSVQETLRRAHVAEPGTRFTLVVDATGVGNPVIDMFRAGRGDYKLVPVGITAGGQANFSKSGIHHVPKQDLLSRLTLMVDQRTLEIAPSLPMREALIRELTSFRPNKEPLDGEQDDMILALSLATWRSWKRVL